MSTRVDHLGDRRVLADDDEDRGSRVAARLSLSAPEILAPLAREQGDRRERILEDRLGLGTASLPSPLRGCELLPDDPVPDVEVVGVLLSAGVAQRQLRDLHQPRLDRVHQPELAYDPGERPPRHPAHPPQVVRRGREVEPEVDPAELVHPVEPFDPDGRLTIELVLVIPLVEFFIPALVPPDPVGMVGLVVHHQDVLLAADLAADDPRDDRGVALDPPLPIDHNSRESAGSVALLIQHPDRARRLERLERLWRHVAKVPRRRRLLRDADGLLSDLADAGLHHPGAHLARVGGLGLEHVPVTDHHPPPRKQRHEVRRHQVSAAIERGVAACGV